MKHPAQVMLPQQMAKTEDGGFIRNLSPQAQSCETPHCFYIIQIVFQVQDAVFVEEPQAAAHGQLHNQRVMPPEVPIAKTH